ncbi:MAG: hypothetical protein VB958_03685 [Thalassolituus sp.]|uniref:hypothetical protein n=1 Tax=Thalassolituus sp. TaxID=2030822 RepID=UPI0039824BE7
MWRTGSILLLSIISAAVQAEGLYWRNDVNGGVKSGAGTRFSSNELSLTIPLERKRNGSEDVSTALNLDLTEFRWSGTTAAQSEYYWISMPISYRQRRSGGQEFYIRAEPGLMTDLNALEGKNIGVNVELSGRTYVSKSDFWQYGIIVDREFGDFNPRPLVGYATKPTAQTEMLLGFPKTLIQTRWSREVSTYLSIRPAGGVWREEVTLDAAATVTPSVSDVKYTNWRMGVGGEFHWRERFWLNGEIGQLRNRRIRATDNTGVEVVATPGQDAYWQIGITARMP